MKLLYVTRVDINLKSAQSLQIRSMSKALHRNCDSFSLLYRRSQVMKGGFTYDHPINVHIKSSFLSAVIFYILAFKYILVSDWDEVYTRDIVVIFICLLLRKRCIYEIHHDFEGKIGKFLFNLCKNSKLLVIIFISDGAMKRFQLTYNFKATSMVSHDGYDPEIFKLSDIQNNNFDRFIEQYDLNILHCGSFSELKGADKIKDIVENYPKIGFIQIGDAVNSINSKNLLEELKLKENFFFISQLKNTEVGYYLLQASVLFFPMDKRNPYWWCTSPLKLVEYIASGKPILGSFVGSSRELIDQQPVIEFDAENPHDMHLKIRYLRRNIEYVNNKVNLNSGSKGVMTWDQRACQILSFLKHSNPYAEN